MSVTPTIVWFRQDLRLADNPALTRALAAGPIIPIYIAPTDSRRTTRHDGFHAGGASRWWLHHSLVALDRSLRDKGSRLLVRRGEPATVLRELAEQAGAASVHWNRRLEPAGIATDREVKQALRETGLAVQSFNGNYLHEPWNVLNKQAKPYKVFTPYWKALLAAGIDQDVLPEPERLEAVPGHIESETVDALDLLPTLGWADDFSDWWTPGESGAWDRFETFLDEVDRYHETRNRMDLDGTSRLSPHLHFGEISPRQVVARVRAEHPEALEEAGTEAFLREIGWREFAANLIYHFPQTERENLDARFDALPWENDPDVLAAWQRGQTGIPVVDAAMRALWATGWMHNRARMIVASFLTKNCLVDWRHGADWFMDTLVDADLPSNTAGWQWVAGSGADAAPYFRIFNPVLQGEKFDPEGSFIRHWVPELADLPDKALYAPWEAKPATLQDAGVTLGETYPEPVVDLKASRQRALDAFQQIKDDSH
ncbi:DNA photolyase family protein [Guyparkeria hydrothermalis]|uniref:cryptochrome/photolyase family protein n=1 Tax=Guyparkeria hydrothermalis TaxID=923 RepID=UPI002021CDF9|nr:deoxyribodipyrimidine photo-lyase [Guyparkeria hydrothermalis]MCL7745161.1 DNA photolyase family protein [Guyparkeria hydrothermalis]